MRLTDGCVFPFRRWPPSALLVAEARRPEPRFLRRIHPAASYKRSASIRVVAAAGGLYFALEDSSGALAAERGALWVPVVCFGLTAVAALVAFGLRGKRLHRERRDEMRTPGDVFPSERGDEAVAYLEGMQEFR